MPSSHGGGSSGGGSHGGGGFRSSGSGRNNTPKFSREKPFPGAIRYFYIDTAGIRRTFYYGGVPKRRSLASVIVPPIIFVLLGIVMATAIMLTIIPAKLKPKKCTFSGVYISDQDDLFSEREEELLKESFKAFYDKTGIEPYLYAFESSNLPSKYGSETNQKAMEDYAYDIYVNTFSDEGHFMILYSETRNSDEITDWIWIDMAGDDTNDLIDDSAFVDFQSSMQRYLHNDSIPKGEAIAKSFDESTETIMKPSVLQLVFLSIFFLFYLGLPIYACVSNVKEVRETNQYCDYRDKNGGKEFFETPSENDESGLDFSTEGEDENMSGVTDESKESENVGNSSDDEDGSDLFD